MRGMGAVMAAARIRREKEIAEKVWTGLHAAGSPKARLSSKILRLILLEHGDISLFLGRMMVLKKRSMGAGIYEVWLEPRK